MVVPSLEVTEPVSWDFAALLGMKIVAPCLYAGVLAGAVSNATLAPRLVPCGRVLGAADVTAVASCPVAAFPLRSCPRTDSPDHLRARRRHSPWPRRWPARLQCL